MAAIGSLTSCGSFGSMSDAVDAYKYGYNTGVYIRGGSSNEYIE